MPRHRAGPLLDLPLELFCETHTDLSRSSPFKHRPNKRSRSPGGTSLASPAKRRLLDIENIRLPQAKEKSPLNPLRNKVSSHKHLLRGHSPARRIDFSGLSLDSHKDVGRTLGSPTKSPLANALAPSPLGPIVSASAIAPPSFTKGGDVEMSDLTMALPDVSASLVASAVVSGCNGETHSDQQSIHYPGFDVFLDPRSDGRFLLDSSAGTAMEEDSDSHDIHCAPNKLKESEKENIPPRKKLTKSHLPGDAAWAKAGLLCPGAKQDLDYKVDAQRDGTLSPKGYHRGLPGERELASITINVGQQDGWMDWTVVGSTGYGGENVYSA